MIECRNRKRIFYLLSKRNEVLLIKINIPKKIDFYIAFKVNYITEYQKYL